MYLFTTTFQRDLSWFFRHYTTEAICLILFGIVALIGFVFVVLHAIAREYCPDTACGRTMKPRRGLFHFFVGDGIQEFQCKDCKAIRQKTADGWHRVPTDAEVRASLKPWKQQVDEIMGYPKPPS